MPRPNSLAARADRHVLYQRAVQCPEADVDFVDRTLRKLRGRTPACLREDFCGTGAISCEWARRRAANTALGLDLHQPTLEWGLKHNVAKLSPGARARVRLIRRNVLTPGVGAGGMDAILAFNFSYWVFKERETLRRYFRAVRRSLARGGAFFLDIYGGYELLKECRDRQQIGGSRGFTYFWDQARCDPLTGETLCHIHFRLRDGSWLRRAFTYDWRAWSVPEVREVLAEAGFKRSTVYWEGDDGKGGGNGIFRPAKRGEACASFIAYIVAER